MRKVTYLAVFEPSSDGAYGVYFPDLPGCTSFGSSFEEAQREAVDALGLHLYGMEKDGEEIPQPSSSVKVDPETAEGYFVSPVSVFPDLVRNEIDNRAARVNTTVPTWLKEIAEDRKVNFSQLLTAALMEYLDIQGPGAAGELRAGTPLGHFWDMEKNAPLEGMENL